MSKMEVRSICIDGRFVMSKDVEICTVCNGHRPVTKKPADGECLGHAGVKEYLLPLGEQMPQAPRENRKVKAKKAQPDVLDPVDQMDVEATMERAEEDASA